MAPWSHRSVAAFGTNDGNVLLASDEATSSVVRVGSNGLFTEPVVALCWDTADTLYAATASSIATISVSPDDLDRIPVVRTFEAAEAEHRCTVNPDETLVAMEPLGAFPGTVVVATRGPGQTASLSAFDPRTSPNISGAAGRVVFGGRTSIGVVAEAVACHASEPLVATAGKIGGGGQQGPFGHVQLWDVRAPLKPIAVIKRTDVLSRLVWHPADGECTLLGLVVGDAAVRCLQFFPMDCGDRGDIGSLGSGNSLRGGGGGAATGGGSVAGSGGGGGNASSDEPNARSWRVVEKSRVPTRAPLRDVAWLLSTATSSSKARGTAGGTASSSVPMPSNAAATKPFGEVAAASPKNDLFNAGSGPVAAALGLAADESLLVTTVQRGPSWCDASPDAAVVAFEGTVAVVAPAAVSGQEYSSDASLRMLMRLRAGFSLSARNNQQIAAQHNDKFAFTLFRYLDTLRVGHVHGCPGLLDLVVDDSKIPEAAFKNLTQARVADADLSPLQRFTLALAGWFEGYPLEGMPEYTKAEQGIRMVAVAILRHQFRVAADLLVAVPVPELGAKAAKAQHTVLAALLRSLEYRVPSESELGAVCNGVDELLGIALGYVGEASTPSFRPAAAGVLSDTRLALVDRLAISSLVVERQDLHALWRLWLGALTNDNSPAAFVICGLQDDTVADMQRCVDVTGDVQLAVAAFAHLRSLAGQRAVSRWAAAYREWLNAWGHYLDRARFDVELRQLESAVAAAAPSSAGGCSGTPLLMGRPGGGGAASLASGGRGGGQPLHAAPPPLSVVLHCKCGQELHGSAHRRGNVRPGGLAHRAGALAAAAAGSATGPRLHVQRHVPALQRVRRPNGGPRCRGAPGAVVCVVLWMPPRRPLGARQGVVLEAQEMCR